MIETVACVCACGAGGDNAQKRKKRVCSGEIETEKKRVKEGVNENTRDVMNACESKSDEL